MTGLPPSGGPFVVAHDAYLSATLHPRQSRGHGLGGRSIAGTFFRRGGWAKHRRSCSPLVRVSRQLDHYPRRNGPWKSCCGGTRSTSVATRRARERNAAKSFEAATRSASQCRAIDHYDYPESRSACHREEHRWPYSGTGAAHGNDPDEIRWIMPLEVVRVSSQAPPGYGVLRISHGRGVPGHSVGLRERGRSPGRAPPER